jgi:ribosomal protein S18 acetylase RimI-like enzyme
MPNTLIRSMLDSDRPFIHQGLSETNWQDIPEDQKTVLNRSECDKRIINDFEYYRSNARFKFRVFLAVLGNGESAGFISVGELANPAIGLPMGAILDFWVKPAVRRQGIGSELLDHAIEYIRSQGYTHASILVSQSNNQAMRLYQRRGFYPDRLTMVKRVS